MSDQSQIKPSATEEILKEYYIPNPEETVAIASIEQFFFDSATFDVWNSQSALSQDYLVVIEFSEIEGPKACQIFPDDSQLHFDSSEMALRLMTADYQGSGRGPFSVPIDTNLLLTNEEQGVHAFVYHFSLFDLEARGYIRPYCIAYCSDDWSKVFQLLDILKDEIQEVTDSLKACNMRLMCKELSEAIDLLQNLEARTVSNYYEITYNENEFGHQKSPEAQNLKAMRLRRDLEAVYSVVAGQGKFTGSPRHCTETHELSNVEAWIHWFIDSCGSRNDLHQMKTLSELCPCVCQTAMQRLNRILTTYVDFSPLTKLFFDGETPAVLAGKVPLLFAPGEKKMGKNDLLKDFDVNNDDSSTDDVKVLHSIAGALPNVLFPILSGRTLIVGGGDTRRKTVMQLVRLFAKLIPGVQEKEHRATVDIRK